MMRRILICMLWICFAVVPVAAQVDAVELPAELYILTNSGTVQQVGLGAAGIRTVTPEDTFVLDFGVAPDGNWLAYRTQDGLRLGNIYTGEETITVEGETASVPPLRGRGDTMDWSPQGDALAYTTAYGARFYFNTGSEPVFLDVREGQFFHLDWSPDGRYLMAAAEGNIWWVYRREESNMVLTSAIPSALGAVWYSPTELAFTPPEGGLILMDLGNANAQTVLLDNTFIYEQPQRLPDGRLVAFARDVDDTEVEPGSGRLTAFTPGAAGAESLSDTLIDVSTMRWTPPGNLNFLIAFQGGVMALIDPITSDGFTLPFSDAVAYGWGPALPLTVTGLELPADGYFLSDFGTGVAQVWRLPADGTPSQPITTAESNVTGYAVSPQARTLVYSSDSRLWLLRLESEAEPVELAQLGSDADAQPAFNLDGQRVAYVDGGIWMVSIDGVDAESVLENTTETYTLPRFAPNLEALLVNISTEGGGTTGLFDPNSGEVLRMPDGYINGRWLNGGRILTFGVPDPIFEGGLHLTDTTTLDVPAVLLPDTVSVLEAGEIEQGSLRLLLVSTPTGPSALRVVDMNINDGQLTPVANEGYMVAPRLSPDGQFIAGYRYLSLNETIWQGPLTIRSLATGQQVAFSQPSPVWGFQWGPLR
jgi:WD40 repeat protein